MVARAYLLDTSTEAITKLNSPGLMAALQVQAEFHETQKAIGEPAIGSRRRRQKYGTLIDGVQCAT